MAIPIASFTFITSGLTVVITDTSTEAPTSWSWTFGDVVPGPPGTSTEQNPLYTYSEAGTYGITLVATNGDGPSLPVTEQVIVNNSNTTPIDSILEFETPPSITYTQSEKNYLLQKWRVYLQQAFEIADEYLNDETKYTLLENILLAKLIVHDLILQQAREYLSKSLGASSSTSSGGGSSRGGNIKKIETGPTTVEWYSSSDTLSEVFKVGASGSSVFDELLQDICGLGNKLRVKLPMCEQFDTNPIVPIKTDKIAYLTSYNFLQKHLTNAN